MIQKQFFTEEEETIIAEIEHVFHALKNFSSLNPSERVDAAFERLVSVITETKPDQAERIISSDRLTALIPQLRGMSSQGESLLEIQAAKDVVSDRNPQEALKRFRYYRNYESLAKKEFEALEKTDWQKGKALFIGSGPLPLTAILLAQRYSVALDLLEPDHEAFEISRRLVSALGLSEKISIFRKKGQDYPLGDYGIIMLAALAGKDDAEKSELMLHIFAKTEKGTHVLLRNAEGLAKLSYQPIREEDIRKFDLKKVIPAEKDMVNSVLVVQKI